MEIYPRLLAKWHVRWCSPIPNFYFTNLYGQQNNLGAWVWCIWNEYDDWLYNGIHGFRILGFEVNQAPQWLWKILPILRFFLRRPERTRQ